MTLMWAGSILGGLLGIAHAIYVFNTVANKTTPDTSLSYTAAYYAIWTFGLWVLFGTYVLVLWVVGVVLYFVFKAFR